MYAFIVISKLCIKKNSKSDTISSIRHLTSVYLIPKNQTLFKSKIYTWHRFNAMQCNVNE